MSDIHDYVLKTVKEATESQIEDNVYRKIKQDIFRAKIAGGIGALLIALAVLFYKPIFAFIVERGGEEFKQSIDASIEKQRALGREIETSFTATGQFARKELGSLQDLLLMTRADIQTERTKLEAILNSLRDAQLAAAESRDTFVQRVAAAQTGTDEVRKKLDDTVAQLNALIENQNSIVSALNKANAKPDKIASITRTTPLADGKKTTVYFQFAGFTRADAMAVSNALQSMGWSIPGEERTTAAINTNEVRFNPKDVAIADRLRTDGNDALRRYNIQLKLAPNNAITAGIPEEWIYRP